MSQRIKYLVLVSSVGTRIVDAIELVNIVGYSECKDALRNKYDGARE
jgi:hypothetical protein